MYGAHDGIQRLRSGAIAMNIATPVAAFSAHARARELGIDGVASLVAELQIRGFAGRATELPVRQRIRPGQRNFRGGRRGVDVRTLRARGLIARCWHGA